MDRGLIFDTSVVLNILGSGYEREIMGALPGRRLLVVVTSREILRHPLAQKHTKDPLATLVGAGLIEKVSLPPEAAARFVRLTGADPPNDLDDGEAAALAVAEILGLSVALDETKGRRVARELMPQIPLRSSVELFRHPAVGESLGDALADAVYSALVNTRMRVLAEHDAWVRDLIGVERASGCPSLRMVRSQRPVKAPG